MHTKNLVSAATIAIALGFTGTAFGQAVTLGTQTLSEADAERARVHCIDLQNQANAADTGSDTDANDDTTESRDGTNTDADTGSDTGSDSDTGTDTGSDTEGDAGAATASTSEADGEQGTEEGTAGLIELDSVTLEQCIEAGLVE
jgi:hypothetical protein